MPALAVRFNDATSALLGPVTARLAGEFLAVGTDTVDRYVDDARACAEHLGLDATPTLVERVARERLLALVHSAPPAPRGA